LHQQASAGVETNSIKEPPMSEIIELAEKLKSEGEKFIEIFSKLTDDQWKAEVYTESELWTIRNVLSHFVTSERGLVRLFESIRQGGAGATDDFSIDRYNAAQQEKTKDLTPAELLEQYKAIRANSITWVSGLKDEDLEIKGRHPFLEVTTIREMVKMLYLHNQIHYRDLKKALK
jgi:uncharacterized damage-inducible protein DinB